MGDSKRTNALINASLQKEEHENKQKTDSVKLDMIIVSHLFWPTFREENLILPEQVSSQFERYCKQYEHVKRPRQLIKKPNLGTVHVDLEFDSGKILSFSVSPAHASIVWLFQREKTISLDIIATKIGMTREGLRKKIVFWINNQVLQEIQKDVFQLIDYTSPGNANQSSEIGEIVAMAEEEEGQEAGTAAGMEGEMRLCEQYILGMLTNFEKLPLERIHMMLSTFMGSLYSVSMGDLKSFLLKLTKDEKIELIGNEYAKRQ